MNRNEKLFDEIESYLNGTLSPEGAKAFEERMAKDKVLSREVALHKSLHEEIGSTDELGFRELLNTIASEQPVQPQKKTFRWKIAASIALLCAASFYFYERSQNDTSLFEEYYKPYAVEDQLRGTQDTQRDAALELYNAGAYEKATNALQPLLEQNPKDGQLQLYYGNSLLNQNKEADAIAIFKNIPSESSAYEAAQWYLALTYLKAENVVASKTALKDIIAYDGIFKEKAQVLLQEM